MAKAVALICILALAAATFASAKQTFNVQGTVYCDPCRVQFETALSQKLAGAAVRLECKNINTNAVTYSADSVTNADGEYTLPVVGDHADDICEVIVVKSPRPDCSEPMTEVPNAKVDITKNVGMVTSSRYANPLGFMTKSALGQCKLLPEIEALFANFD